MLIASYERQTWFLVLLCRIAEYRRMRPRFWVAQYSMDGSFPAPPVTSHELKRILCLLPLMRAVVCHEFCNATAVRRTTVCLLPTTIRQTSAPRPVLLLQNPNECGRDSGWRNLVSFVVTSRRRQRRDPEPLNAILKCNPRRVATHDLSFGPARSIQEMNSYEEVDLQSGMQGDD